MTDNGTTGGELHLTLGAMLRKLSQRSSVLAGVPLAVVRRGQPLGAVVRADFERARRLGLVEKVEGRDAWRLSNKGRDTVRRLTCGAVEAPPRMDRPGVNLDESPLAWLKRRRGKDGVALISEAQFLAGERLRQDFTFGQLGPRVTASWDAAVGARGGGRNGLPGAPVEIADNVLAARERVNRALHDVGPELAGILLDVCCFLKGLEELERSTGWPQRSGKVVLQLALSALARHYGFEASETEASRRAPRHWGAPDYRPAIGQGGEGVAQPAAD